MKTNKIPKTTKGWKIITKGRFSAFNTNVFSIKYPINETVMPTLKGSKLFFFKDKRYARNFLKCNDPDKDSLAIVPCIATNPQKMKVRAFYIYNPEYIEIFWRNTENAIKHRMTSPCPKGTYIADSIKCLK